MYDTKIICHRFQWYSCAQLQVRNEGDSRSFFPKAVQYSQPGTSFDVIADILEGVLLSLVSPKRLSRPRNNNPKQRLFTFVKLYSI